MHLLEPLVRKGPIRTFLLLLLALSALPYALIIADGNTDSQWVLLLMWMPGVAALLAQWIHQKTLKGLGWRPRPVAWLLLALFGPLLFHSLLALGATFSGLLPAASDYIAIEDGRIRIAKTALLFGTSDQHPLFFVFNYLLSFAVGNLLYVFIALGEELGWRAFFQERLAQHLPLGTTYIVLGLIWGYWHAPGILLGHNFPQYPVLGAFVIMPIMTVLLSVILGEAWRRTKSVWVPALLHGSFNLAASIPSNAIQDPFSDGPVYDLLFFILLALVALWCWRTADRPLSATSAETPASPLAAASSA